MSKLNLFVPLTKVDESKREVWGVAAEEAPDKTGEIMDYAKSKPRFQEWSQQIAKASGGKSLGNVREMHQPNAVGKLIDLQFDDTAKKIYVGAKIVDDTAWKKVSEGVYTGFSIGGDYGEMWRDVEHPTLKRYEAIPAEVSTVDNPAMYGATFEMIRANGASELRKFAAPLKKEDDAPSDEKPEDDAPPKEEQAKEKGDDEPKDDAADKDRAEKTPLALNLEKLAKCYPDAVAIDAGDWDVSRALSVLAQVSALMQSEAWTGETEHVALVSSILAQLQTFLDAEIAEARAFAEREAQVVADDRLANAEQTLAEVTEPTVTTDEETETLEMAARGNELQKAAANGANARVILESKIHQAYTVTCDQLLQRGYIDRATRLKISKLMGEMLTAFADALGAELEKVNLSPADVDFIAAKLAQGELLKLDPAKQDLEKRGARHNAGDAAMLQTIHDHACALGANCESGAEKEMNPDELKKWMDAAATERAAQTETTLQKLIGDAIAPLAQADELNKVMETTGELGKRAEELEKQLKALAERVAVVEKTPEGQLPVLRVVKRDGAPETVEKADALAVLEKYREDASLDAVTRSAVGKILALEEMKKTIQQGPQKIGAAP